MSSATNILYLIALFVIIGSGAAFASDDNPWSMQETDDKPGLYFDLDGRVAAGPLGQTPKETSRAKSPALKGRATSSGASGKQNRDQLFGYSGAPPKKRQVGPEKIDAGRFGAFPSQDGSTKEAMKSGSPTTAKGGIQFGGKSFGAFPPKEKKADRDLRHKLQKNLMERQRLLQQGSSGFANVLPRPIPAPVPATRLSICWREDLECRADMDQEMVLALCPQVEQVCQEIFMGHHSSILVGWDTVCPA